MASPLVRCYLSIRVSVIVRSRRMDRRRRVARVRCFFRAGHLFDDGEDSGHQRNCQQNEWRFFGFINVDPFVIVYLDRIITVGNELEIKILRFREIVLPAWILRSSTHE